MILTGLKRQQKKPSNYVSEKNLTLNTNAMIPNEPTVFTKAECSDQASHDTLEVDRNMIYLLTRELVACKLLHIVHRRTIYTMDSMRYS